MSKVSDESSLALAAFLKNYKRITVADACRQHIDQNHERLGIWVNQRGEWRRVSADEQKLQWSQYKAGRSVCQSVVRELFGLSAAQYAKIRASFENPGWRTWAGIYERRDESFKGPEFSIVVELPETSSALGVGTAAGVTVGAVGALAAKLLYDRSKSATVTPATVKSGASADSSQIQKLKDKLDEALGINRQLTAKVLALKNASESNEESGEDQGKIQQLEEELRHSKRAFHDHVKNARESLTASQAEVARLQAELRTRSESKDQSPGTLANLLQNRLEARDRQIGELELEIEALNGRLLKAANPQEDKERRIGELELEIEALKDQLLNAAKPQKPSGLPLPEPKGPSPAKGDSKSSKPFRERLEELNTKYADVRQDLSIKVREAGTTVGMRRRQTALNGNPNETAVNTRFDWQIPVPVIVDEMQDELNYRVDRDDWKPYLSRYLINTLRPFTINSKQDEKQEIQKQADDNAEEALRDIIARGNTPDEFYNKVISITEDYYKSVPQKLKAAKNQIW